MAASAASSAADPLHALAELVERAQSVAPARLVGAVTDAATTLGARVLALLLVDFAQQQLCAMHEDQPVEPSCGVPIDGSTAGLAFVRGTPLTTRTETGEVLVSLPLLDGIERVGVLQLSFPPEVDVGELLPLCRQFSDVVTQYVASKGRVTDEFHRLRAARPMTLAAQMQWQVLPPTTAHAPEAVVAGQVEPAYHVGGDAFDYAFNREVLHLAIFDAMGHGVAASVATALAVGAYRNSRRGRDDMPATLRTMDAAVAAEFADDRFVTALLAELELATGRVAFLNAGHLQPLLLRGRHIAPVPRVPPGLPLGLGALLPAAAERVVHVQLEPHDRLLLVTDGILDAASGSGARFGEDRLIELAERAALDQLPLPELARAITRGVFDYQSGSLADDASLLIVEYTGTGGTTPAAATAPRSSS